MGAASCCSRYADIFSIAEAVLTRSALRRNFNRDNRYLYRITIMLGATLFTELNANESSRACCLY